MVGLWSSRWRANNVTRLPVSRVLEYVENELLGYGKPLDVSLEGLNPVVGLYLNGASIFFAIIAQIEITGMCVKIQLCK